MMAGDKVKNSSKTKTTKSKNGSRASPDPSAMSILQSVKTLPAEERYDALVGHFTSLSSEHFTAKNELTAMTKRFETADRTRNQLNTDYTKAMLAKAQLESLCRELQKQNKATKEENIARVREEEEKRREVSNKLNNTLADINGLMQQNTEKNSELRKENQHMGARLGELVTQYEERQKSIEKLLQQKDLELKISETRLKKAQIEAAEEKQTMLTEKKTLLEELQSCQERVTKHSANELALQTQLHTYQEKYDLLKNTVDELNGCMNMFKKEADKTGARIKKMEKDGLQWQVKYKKTEVALLNMSAENLDLKSEVSKLKRKGEKLQQLARSLAEYRKKSDEKLDIDPTDEEDAVEKLSAIQKRVDEIKQKVQQVDEASNEICEKAESLEKTGSAKVVIPDSANCKKIQGGKKSTKSADDSVEQAKDVDVEKNSGEVNNSVEDKNKESQAIVVEEKTEAIVSADDKSNELPTNSPADSSNSNKQIEVTEL